MKRLLLLTVLMSLVLSCSSKRHIERAMYSGNYDHAITDALQKLRNNKNAKWKTKFVILLEESYHKAVERDLQTIERLKKTNDPALRRQIFEIYVNMDARQQAIKPILPLRVGKHVVDFPMKNLDKELIESRNKAVDYEYAFAKRLMASVDKFNQREAYGILEFIESVKPDHKDVRALMSEAHFNGTDHVIVQLNNMSNQFIPNHVEANLLDFNTYGLNDFWTSYHQEAQDGIEYDFALDLNFNQVLISPERHLERQFLREKQIVDGWEYALDEQGNVMQDSLGNDIKIDRIINVRCRFFEIEQTKSARIHATAVYTDLRTDTRINSYPIQSEFVFSNVFGRARGDRRALLPADRQLLNNGIVPFPTHTEMVLNTAEDLKFRFKNILNNYPIGG